MKLRIDQILGLMTSGLIKRGLSEKDSDLIAKSLLQAELMGKKTHGIGKIFLLDDAIAKREAAPEIVKDKANYALINANKELGHISAEFATEVLIRKVKQYDNAFVATYNSFYFSMAGIYAKKVAEAGYVGMIFNNGGPATIAPFGSIDPIFGTNPLAIGIPQKTGAIVLDMTTGAKPWGEVNLAKIEKRKLQEKTFLDKEGKFTTDPYEVEAIIPFGGYKGYGINFILEILTGAFVGAKMGLQSKNGYDLGFLFMAFSPEMFTTRDEFEKGVEQLIKEVKQTRKADDNIEIYLPGEKSEKRLKQAMEVNELEVDGKIFSLLNDFSTGVDVREKVWLKL